jgi:hypothetical protein
MKIVESRRLLLKLLLALSAMSSFCFAAACIPEFSPLDPDALYSHVTMLAEDIGSRNVTEPGNLLASAYIKEKFEEYGLTNACYGYYPDGFGNIYRNVVASIPGTAFPEKIILVEAHFDTKPDVPGAVDNATGIAAMLEYARYYADNPAQYTLKFVAFNGEETGYSGSTYYHEKTLQDGELDNTLFILNLDMMQSNASNPKAPLVLFVLSPVKACLDAFMQTKARMGICAANIHFIPAKFASTISNGLRADVRHWIDDPVAICWPWAYDIYYNKPVDTCDKVDITGLAISSKFSFDFLNRIIKLNPEDFRSQEMEITLPPSIMKLLEETGGIKP